MNRTASAVVGLAIALAGCNSPLPTAPDVVVPEVAVLDVAPPETAGQLEASDNANAAPRLVLKTRPAAQPGHPYPVVSGVAPLTVLFNLCESSDPDQVILGDGTQDPSGDTITWQFHFGDGGNEAFGPDGTFRPDFEHFCRVEHTYSAGRYVATLSVTDKHLTDQSHDVSAQARATERVTIEVSPPVTSSPQSSSPKSLSQTVSGLYTPNVLNFSFSGPAPTGGGTLTITALGDLNSGSEYITLSAPGFSRNVFESGGFQCDGVFGPDITSKTTLALTQSEVAALLGGFTVTPSGAVNDLGGSCGAAPITISLEYAGS